MGWRLVMVVGRREDLAETVHAILDPAVRALVRLIPSLTGALTFVEHLRPALVVADAAIPDGGGLAICERLKARPGMDDVPVLAVDSHATPGEARAAGCDDLAPDPRDQPRAFADTVHRFLRVWG
jgi:CheY-like chemotaxis protein